MSSQTKKVIVQLRPKTIESIDAMAKRRKRDRSALVNEALERYVELAEYHTELVKTGIAQAERGELVEHEDVIKRLRSRKLR